MIAPFSHCSFCGAASAPAAAWPRTCAVCGNTTYRNPLPVSVILLPVATGLLTVRRAIEPQSGQLALPGGYINWGESWQSAGAREVAEETGITIDPAALQPFWFASAPDGTLLVFGLAQPIAQRDLPATLPADEASEIVVISQPQELAFSLHTEASARWFHTQR